MLLSTYGMHARGQRWWWYWCGYHCSNVLLPSMAYNMYVFNFQVSNPTKKTRMLRTSFIQGWGIHNTRLDDRSVAH